MNRANNLLRGAILVVAAATLQSCFVYTSIRKAAHRDRGTAVLADGSRVEGKLRLPKADEAFVRIRPAGEKRQTISADSLDSLRVWQRRSPQHAFYLLRRPYRYYDLAQNSETDSRPMWIVSRAVGKHLAIFALSDGFGFDKTGRMRFSGTVRYLAFKPGIETGLPIGTATSSRSSLRKVLLRLCADDPTLCDRLERGETDPSDFVRIVADYDPRNSDTEPSRMFRL